MNSQLLLAALLLAYGPFAVMSLLYLVGLVLRLGGRPDFLHWLIARTKVPAARPRGEEGNGASH